MTRQPTEQQLGMRLGGGLGKLVSPTESRSSRPPPMAGTDGPKPQAAPRPSANAGPNDVEDELSRSETPLTEPQPPRPMTASVPPPAQQAAPRSRRNDDDEERTRLRPVQPGPTMDAAIAAILAKPPATDVDDDDGPRTNLMAAPDPTSGSKTRRTNRTFVMDPSTDDGAPEQPRGEPPGIRQTVRLGSPSPVARADLPPNANKDVPAAYARTQNVAGGNAAILQAIEEEALALAAREAQSQTQNAGPGGPEFMQVKATMRIADEVSVGGNAPNLLGAAAMSPPAPQGMLAPPLAPPPPPPRPPMSSMASEALAIPPQQRRAGTRGFIENLPGTTVLVVGVALGVVVSAIVAVLVVFLARGS